MLIFLISSQFFAMSGGFFLSICLGEMDSSFRDDNFSLAIKHANSVFKGLFTHVEDFSDFMWRTFIMQVRGASILIKECNNFIF